MINTLLLFAGSLLALALVALTLPLLDKTRQLIKTAALDAVQVYSGWHNAQLDIEQRQVMIEHAHKLLLENRQRLTSGPESEAGQ